MKGIFTHACSINYFMKSVSLKITKMFDFFEFCLANKQFIFIKYFYLRTVKNPALSKSSSEKYDSLGSNANKKHSQKENLKNYNIVTPNSLIINNSIEKSENKIKNLLYRRLNLQSNLFFYNIKKYFFKRMKSFSIFSNPIKLLSSLRLSQNKKAKFIHTSSISNTFDTANELKLKLFDNLEESYIDNAIDINKKKTFVNENSTNKENYFSIPISTSSKNFNNDFNKKVHNVYNNINYSNRSLVRNSNSKLLEEVLDKIQHKNNAKKKYNDIIFCEDMKLPPRKKTISKKFNYHIFVKNDLERSFTYGRDNLDIIKLSKKGSYRLENSLELPKLGKSLLTNNGNKKIRLDKNNQFQDINNFSNKDNLIISNIEVSLLKDIKDISIEIGNKYKKLETLLANNSNLLGLNRNNIDCSNTDVITDKFKHSNKINYIDHTISEPGYYEEKNEISYLKPLNRNDFNLDCLKKDDNGYVKQKHISFLESSLISAIKNESFDDEIRHKNKITVNKTKLKNFSVIQKSGNIEIISNTMNKNLSSKEKINDKKFEESKEYVDNSNFKHKFRKSQNFSFSIINNSNDINSISLSNAYKNPSDVNNKINIGDFNETSEKKTNKKYNKHKRTFNKEFIFHNNYRLKKNSLDLDNNLKKVNFTKTIYGNLGTEKEKDSLKKITSSRQYNNNSLILPNTSFIKKSLNKSKTFSKKKNSNDNNYFNEKYNTEMLFQGKVSTILANGSFTNALDDLNTKNIDEVNKIATFERPQNLSVWKRFLGIFNIFKCGAFHNHN